MQTTTIHVHAESAERIAGNVWALDVETDQLTETESAILAELFPHTAERIAELLAIETAIGSLASPNAVTAALAERSRSKPKAPAGWESAG